ncbi:MAG: uracil-DNA glycosylase [Methylococcaceae bacterium]|nr:uracil-DNA glycosylase [Methylococcaceae bacterium]MCI0668219.1 uracil-DNA glycosylase [Methylococcaceae bacterium]MCI0733247.1 uracil-DNA glycosylase [Methylococcaceae bacterium]
MNPCNERASRPFFISLEALTDQETARDFDRNCRQCPRLVEHGATIRLRYPEYYSAPVPAFGVARPHVLVVGLAPGLHGANASGRPFTGDAAGKILYRMLHEFGFSSRPDSFARDDGLELIACRITNAVQCLPPQNKPLASEISRCNPFLKKEIDALEGRGIILALGHLAHNAVLQALRLSRKDFEFAHHRVHDLKPGMKLIDSYHCSRYNIQTKRLTSEMFREIFRTIVRLFGDSPHH